MIYNIFTKSTRTDDEKWRLIKFTRFDPIDLLECDEMTPWGYDGNPVPETPGVYCKIDSTDDPRVIGYVLQNRRALPGEVRIYSTDNNKAEQNYIWIRKDKSIEIGGDADNMVRYSKLEEAFNELKTDFNNLVAKHNALKDDFNALVTKFNSHTHSYLPGPGAATPSAPPASLGSSSTATGSSSSADITPAKINEIKTS